MHILSEIMSDPQKKMRLAQLIGGACAMKVKIAEGRESIKHLRTAAMHDLRVNAKDFNAEVKKYL